MLQREILEFWLGTIEGIGWKKIHALLHEMKTIEQLYAADTDRLQALRKSGSAAGVLRAADIHKFAASRNEEQIRERWQRLQEKGLRYYSYFGTGGYPDRLRHISQPPRHLYVKGRLPDPDKTAIAIVGARNCSCYGRDMARMFAYRLAQAGVEVISGLALGVDGWAHQGALESGAPTYAVMGGGADICYPPAHRHLYESIVKRGGILSEFAPGVGVRAGFFPLRNRIISGLSDGILVVEARERSGSLITADAALEQGKDVFVIPGRIGDVLSEGCNRLIRQGAIPVLSPADILEYYQIVPFKMEETDAQKQKWDALTKQILEQIGEYPVPMTQIAQTLKKDYAEVLQCLLRLKQTGEVREASQGFFVRGM